VTQGFVETSHIVSAYFADLCLLPFQGGGAGGTVRYAEIQYSFYHVYVYIYIYWKLYISPPISSYKFYRNQKLEYN